VRRHPVGELAEQALGALAGLLVLVLLRRLFLGSPPSFLPDPLRVFAIGLCLLLLVGAGIGLLLELAAGIGLLLDQVAFGRLVLHGGVPRTRGLAAPLR